MASKWDSPEQAAKETKMTAYAKIEKQQAKLDRWVRAIETATGLRFKSNMSETSAYAMYSHATGRCGLKVRVSDHAGAGYNAGTGQMYNAADLDFMTFGRVPSRRDIRRQFAGAIRRNRDVARK